MWRNTCICIEKYISSSQVHTPLGECTCLNACIIEEQLFINKKERNHTHEYTKKETQKEEKHWRFFGEKKLLTWKSILHWNPAWNTFENFCYKCLEVQIKISSWKHSTKILQKKGRLRCLSSITFITLKLMGKLLFVCWLFWTGNFINSSKCLWSCWHPSTMLPMKSKTVIFSIKFFFIYKIIRFWLFRPDEDKGNRPFFERVHQRSSEFEQNFGKRLRHWQIPTTVWRKPEKNFVVCWVKTNFRGYIFCFYFTNLKERLDILWKTIHPEKFRKFEVWRKDWRCKRKFQINFGEKKPSDRMDTSKKHWIFTQIFGM